ncbi:response regulator [Limnoglobus roseus]|uniref:Hybrid sensor histidine kinase/response regulator n=1 Tax=Limnoglobus roseus TaxID=2598579 RepID=A0A5C1A7L0_9BACT|nr:response regulator [Limnoglobus roseus]QEL14207.1 hybrid sensor histidine kinase/response regulator [Limnoglobus roseus]
MIDTHQDYVDLRPLVLVVDDEEMIRTLVRSLLETNGYRVVEAENGFRAAELISNELEGVDLLITDVRMPGLTGPDLARKLRAEKPLLPIVFISGYVGDVVMDNGSHPRITEYLSKPFALPSMLAAVRRLLTNSGVAV